MSAHRQPDPEFDAWVQRAKEAAIDRVAADLGAKLRKAGANEYAGPCPVCGGDDRFAINTKSRVYLCRGSGSNNGSDGGDVIAMVRHVKGCEFVQAVEFITGEPAPNRRQRGDDSGPDESVLKERREEKRDRATAADQKEAQERREAMDRAAEMFERGAPFANSYAMQYLQARGLRPSPDQCRDLRFMPDAPYWGFERATDKTEKHLGDFPAMLAAIRNIDGDIIGVHRTFLDPKRPVKLTPPGAASKNKAKKVWQMQRGGAIWLGPPAPVIAIAEGIETALAWYQLGMGPDDLTVISSVSLGNLAGGATGSRPHPTIARRTIQNGKPDPASRGIVLPDSVREVIILGDGDSDAAATRAQLMTAGNRFRAEGRVVSVHMAPDGMDWNDVLRARERDEDGAAA